MSKLDQCFQNNIKILAKLLHFLPTCRCSSHDRKVLMGNFPWTKTCYHACSKAIFSFSLPKCIQTAITSSSRIFWQIKNGGYGGNFLTLFWQFFCLFFLVETHQYGRHYKTVMQGDERLVWFLIRFVQFIWLLDTLNLYVKHCHWWKMYLAFCFPQIILDLKANSRKNVSYKRRQGCQNFNWKVRYFVHFSLFYTSCIW